MQQIAYIWQGVQANCADGSVLFASLQYKIGIDPILVIKPGHMFVGYYLDANHKQFEFLETTMLGTGHQPGITRNVAFSPLLHPVQSSESWQQFVQAIQYATNMFTQEVGPAIQQHRPHYRLIDVAKARQAGVNAIHVQSGSVCSRTESRLGEGQEVEGSIGRAGRALPEISVPVRQSV